MVLRSDRPSVWCTFLKETRNVRFSSRNLLQIFVSRWLFENPRIFRGVVRQASEVGQA